MDKISKDHTEYSVVGDVASVFKGDPDAVSIARMMIASNTLIALHDSMENVLEGESPHPEKAVFQNSYFLTYWTLAIGALSEAMASVRSNEKLFKDIESGMKKRLDDPLPVADRIRLQNFAAKDSLEAQVIEHIRSKAGFHWNQAALLKSIDKFGVKDREISRVVKSKNRTIVNYSIANEFVAEMATGIEIENAVRITREVMELYLSVASEYIPAYLVLRECRMVEV